MSYDIYFTIAQNKKTRYLSNSLFFGKRWVYDYKKLGIIFDTYWDARNYILDHKLIDVHVVKIFSSGGGVTYTHYFKKRK